MSKSRLHPVILAGGSGTRFWPLSRRARPKQLLPLASSRPLVEETAGRLAGLAEDEDLLVVCGQAHEDAIRALLPAGSRVLVEPAARSTAPAIGLAALLVAKEDPEGILVVLPSDHAIGDVDSFRRDIATAANAAREGALVTLGIRPTRPDTGFGYIKVGEAHPYEAGARKVLAFVEKPDRRKAEGYLLSGDYLWNAGIFVFRADRILQELTNWAPEVAEVLRRIEPTVGTDAFDEAVRRWFPQAPSISIDYAVMEKTGGIAVVPGEFGWSDLGTFDALGDVIEADRHGNVVRGEAIAVDARRNVVVGQEGKTVALVGCSDLVVIDTGDALLICPRGRTQEVRKVVEALEARGADELL